jgi:RimJ/RimL family protein N-acetyltransferase
MDPADCVSACRLASDRLVLEPLRPEHAAELAPVLADDSLHRFMGGRPESVEQLRARYERQLAGRSPDGRERWLNWVVRVRCCGHVVGTMQATVSSNDGQAVAELAWVIGVGHQRQGLAKDAARLVVDWLHVREVSCVRAHIHPDHHASMGVARSLGLLPTDLVEGGEVRWKSS